MTSAPSTTPFQIPVRRDVAFDFGATPAHHFAGNPRTSHLWNAVSILAPQTEAFLIRAMKRARVAVQDEVLRRQVDAFLAQEALHTRHHMALNSRLAELGYDLERASAAAERSLRRLTDRNDLRNALGLVIAGEYAIYILSRAVLEDPDVLAPTTREVRRLLLWHALEEMEHQSVACDVYHHLYGKGVRHRFIHMRALVKACRVLVDAIRGIETILMESESQLKPAQRRAHSAYLLWSPGLLWRVLAKLPRFFAPAFRHWSDRSDSRLIAAAVDRVYDEARNPHSTWVAEGAAGAVQ